MDRHQEVETARMLWKKLCELENILFDHYGDKFIDMYTDDQIEMAKANEEIDWPF